MTDDKSEDKQPTEDEVKVANEAEEKKWEGDFKDEDLVVPYKREDDKSDKEDKEEPEESKEEPKPDKEEDKEPETPEPEEPEEPQVEDPGDFKPKDYSFKVTLADGKTKTIKTPEEAEKLAEDPDNFETPAQLMDFINKQSKMVNGIERDKEKYEDKKSKFQEQVEAEEERRETVENFVNEFSYLEGKGLLPKVPAEYKDADWQDPEIAKQDGVKEHIEVLNYMVKENQEREKAKVAPLTSVIDAFNAMQADTSRKTDETKRKAAGEARKAAGSKVAGVSPSQQGSYVPKGIAVGNPNVLKRGAAQWDD